MSRPMQFDRVPLSARIGMAIILAYVAAALFGPFLAPYGQTEVAGDQWTPLFWSQPGPDGDVFFLLGTDHLGRDLLTRLLYGARNSIGIALVTTLLAFAAGVGIGLLAATKQGVVDQIASRSIDVLMAFPSLIFALMILAVLGSSIPVLIVVIALLNMASVFRITRALAMDLEAQDFVDVAKLRGESALWIMRRELLPNAMVPLAAEFGLRFCFVLLFIASLSFIGLGIQPPMADWGSMVRENASAISFGVFTPLIPAAAIAGLTIGVNLVIDWLTNSRSVGNEA
ncbi:peptide/nickel transport system permease protein [Pseudaminobacter salicylatoxidans]|uniref:Peptide/nickel transport system permease protein n=1 Tax=Pseudaminobacter salicylatoxidans TaxID=93369 RepID=A0A316CB66_PSESE|nr:ABC transporter permease [Pseudaminobacter salicylatoxidans]PWJ86326.1 peptide/nickel transport system permease protein [Pseudaminobacter salicylatoxidans]